MVEHGASNAKIMGSIPRESKSWSKCKKKTVTWMQCKSLWIKASAKCINVNVNVAHSISTLHPIRSLKHALSLLSGKTHHLQCKTGHIGQTCPTLALLFYCLIAYCNKGLYLLRQSRRSVFRRQGATQTPSTVTPIPVSGGHQPDWAICTGVCVFTLSHNTHGQCAPHTERDLHNRCWGR